MTDNEALLNSLEEINKALGIVAHCKCGKEWRPDMTQFGCWSCGAENPYFDTTKTIAAIEELKALAKIGEGLSQSKIKFDAES